MKSLFQPPIVQEVKTRIANLKPDSAAEWGTMSAAQAMAHCTGGLQMALGDSTPPRVLIGRLIGGIIKPMALKDEVPMRRNSPTAKSLVVADDRDLPKEKQLLTALMHPASPRLLRQNDPAGVGHPDVQAPRPPPPPIRRLTRRAVRAARMRIYLLCRDFP
jgi:hypothetical protein